MLLGLFMDIRCYDSEIIKWVESSPRAKRSRIESQSSEGIPEITMTPNIEEIHKRSLSAKYKHI